MKSNGLKKILLELKVIASKIQMTQVLQNAHYLGSGAGLW